MASNIMFSGTGPDGINLGRRPANLLHISVQDAPIGVSLDGGENYMELEIGMHTLRIGIVVNIQINGSGTWQIIVANETEDIY